MHVAHECMVCLRERRACHGVLRGATYIMRTLIMFRDSLKFEVWLQLQHSEPWLFKLSEPSTRRTRALCGTCCGRGLHYNVYVE